MPGRTVAFKTLLQAAHTLADKSGPLILKHFRRAMTVENKQAGGFDPVTAADRGAEKLIAAELARRFPDHGLIGEEFGSVRAEARYRWVIDPIDGTRSFIIGTPMWGTLIGLLDGGRAALGVLDQPYTGERFWSAERASYMRSVGGRTRKLSTRACPQIGEAIVATTHPDLFAAGYEAESFAKLKSAARMTRFGGDCYSYGMLAAGLVDVVMEAGLKSHDIVAIIPIIERAGGRVTTWDGEPATSGGNVLACGDAKLHDKVLRMIRR
ncbi:MAG: histidinol-phosphatase [Hyphomicrobiaceae bacterium]